MTDYATFCKHYDLDPATADARQQYQEAQEALTALHAAAATQEAKEAINRAKG
mgnify:CR=1 FL=1